MRAYKASFFSEIQSGFSRMEISLKTCLNLLFSPSDLILFSFLMFLFQEKSKKGFRKGCECNEYRLHQMEK